MKLFIYTLLAIVAAVFLTLYLDLINDPGYLLIAWRNYTFETSLFAIAVLLVTLAVAVRLLLLLLSWLNPLRLFREGGLFARRMPDSSRSRTTEGLTSFVRKDWQNACAVLERSFSDPEATVVNYLAAAHAACALGKETLWQDYLDQAAKKFPVAISQINSVRGELLLKSDHLEQALVVLEQVKRTSANDRSLLLLLRKVYEKLEEWEKLDALMPELEKAGVLDSDEFSRLEKLLFRKKLERSAG